MKKIMENQYTVKIADDIYIIEHNKVIGKGPLTKTLRDMYYEMWVEMEENETGYVPSSMDYVVEKVVDKFNGTIIKRPKSYDMGKDWVY